MTFNIWFDTLCYDISWGISRFVVNLVFLPPKYEVKLFRKIYILQDDIIRWTRLAVRQASEHTSTKQH